MDFLALVTRWTVESVNELQNRDTDSGERAVYKLEPPMSH